MAKKHPGQTRQSKQISVCNQTCELFLCRMCWVLTNNWQLYWPESLYNWEHWCFTQYNLGLNLIKRIPFR